MFCLFVFCLLQFINGLFGINGTKGGNNFLFFFFFLINKLSSIVPACGGGRMMVKNICTAFTHAATYQCMMTAINGTVVLDINYDWKSFLRICTRLSWK